MPPPTFLGHAYLKFSRMAKIEMGEGFVCRSGPLYSIDVEKASKIIVKDNAELIIGKCSGISNTTIQCHKSIRIGDYVNIGAGTLIMDTNFHSTDWHIRQDRKADSNAGEKKSIIIDDNCFIGACCVICKGVRIGKNSLIAAGSVVVKDIPDNCMAGGNPCKVIKCI